MESDEERLMVEINLGFGHWREIGLKINGDFED